MSNRFEHVGITGTRHGMTADQKAAFAYQLEMFQERSDAHTFHHGDCVGADVEGARIARGLGFRIVAHPPINVTYRAYHDSDEIREPKAYFDRNRDIVDGTGVLFACPEGPESDRSGTWYTVRYARKVGARYTVVSPVPLVFEERDGWDDYISPRNRPAAKS